MSTKNSRPQHAAKLLATAAALAFAGVVAGCGGSDSLSPPAAAIAFVAPPAGATVEVGKTLTIKLAITHPAAFANSIYVIGQGDLGSTEVAVQASATATLAVPANAALGHYTLTAIGQPPTSTDRITASTSVRVIPNPAIPIPLQLPQGPLTFEAIGERLPITVPGATKGLQYRSAAPAIATVSASGIVIAQKAGDTTITITAPPSGSFVGSVPVHVLRPALLPSVTSLDFGKQAVGTTSATQPVTLTNQAAYPVSVLAVS